MQVEMKKTLSYATGPATACKVCEGEVVELPEDIASAWLERGVCEKVGAKKETKVVEPVEETKAAPKKTTARKPRAKKAAK